MVYTLKEITDRLVIPQQDLKEIRNLALQGIFCANSPRSIKEKIYKLSKGTITDIFFGDNYLFARIGDGNTEISILQDIAKTKYRSKIPQRTLENINSGN